MKATETGTSGIENRRLQPDDLREPVPAGQTGTATASPGPKPPASPSRSRSGLSAGARRRPLGLGLGALGGIAVATWVAYGAWNHARSWETTDNAYVAAHIHTISARIAGTVQEVLVEENRSVAAGEVLVRLDTRDLAVKREQARAQVVQARAQTRQAEAQIAQARAQISREQARAVQARNNLERAQALYQGASGAISKQEFDQAQAESDAAGAAVQGAQSALEAATALAGAAAAQEQVALANLQDAELQLSYTEIVAPAPGRIGKRNLEAGNRVQPGQALLALVQPEVWVTANFKETQLATLKPGQTVRVRFDAFPRHPCEGVIDSLAPASGAQFALLPPDNATGNFTRIVQRVPVKITLAAAGLGEFAGRIMPGMSAIVEVKVHE